MDVSNKLIVQSQPSVDAIISNDLLRAAAIGIDAAGFTGAGTNAPTGIVNTTGVNSIAAAAVTYQKLREFVRKVMEANAQVPTCKWFMTPNGWEILGSREKISGYPQFLLGEDDKMVGYQGIATNQLTHATKEYLIFGDVSQLFVGYWGVVDLLVDPYKNKETGLTRLWLEMFADAAVRIPAAFSVANDLS